MSSEKPASCEHCGAVLATDDPSPAEARVLEFVLDFHRRRMRFPTYREIGEGLEVSRQAADRHVQALGEKGWITVRWHYGIQAARGIEVDHVDG